jgi:hypothetical protein
MKSELLSVIAAALLAVLPDSAAQASPITYALDVVFQGGGTASGTFDFDPTYFDPTSGPFGTVSNVNLASTLDNPPYGPIPPEAYLSGSSALLGSSGGPGPNAFAGFVFYSIDSSTELLFLEPIGPGFTSLSLLQFDFGSPGSITQIDANGNYDPVVAGYLGPQITVVAGDLRPQITPLPSAWTMMLAGMGMMGFLTLPMRRKFRSAP